MKESRNREKYKEKGVHFERRVSFFLKVVDG